jgi:SMC interacting uncharacterized protein involved in chromosome segregation
MTDLTLEILREIRQDVRSMRDDMDKLIAIVRQMRDELDVQGGALIRIERRLERAEERAK